MPSRECDGSSSAPAGEVNLQGGSPPPRTEANFPRAPDSPAATRPLQIQWFVLAGIAVVVCLGVSIFCFIKRKAVARRAAGFEAAKKPAEVEHGRRVSEADRHRGAR